MRAFFLQAADVLGQRLCLHHAPAAGPPRGAVVYVHPWAEEMNKSRRMAALQSRALAGAGYAVLQIDLHGCGDSSGDFGDASWAGWVGDLLLAARWLQGQHPGAPLCLWGLRAGALLATQAAQELGGACQLLLWQPVLSGQQHLQQFLRLKAAAEMAQGDAKGLLARLRGELGAGRDVEVAGYRLPPALALGLEQAQLELPPNVTHTAWLEVTTRADAALLPASATRVAAWRAHGHALAAQAVTGPAFWQTQEIEDAPALIVATLGAMQAGPPGPGT